MSSLRQPVYLFGEVLFDQLPDRRVLGGAPFNAAWNLTGLGLPVGFISRVGADDDGERIRAAMQLWKMSDHLVETDPEIPTGKVQVQFDASGEPSYDICAPAAYDAIQCRQLPGDDGQNPETILYHGTLALRDERSRANLLQMRTNFSGGVFVDLNLRAPHWSAELLRQILPGAHYIKLNREELDQCIRIFDINPELSMDQQARQLCQTLELDACFVTLGPQGALLATAHCHWLASGQHIEQTADEIGAGDAFSAVCLAGISRGWPWEQILRRAVTFSARICTIPGAISEDPEFYRQFGASWLHSDA